MSDSNIWDPDTIPAQAAVDEAFYQVGFDSLRDTMDAVLKIFELPKEVLDEYESGKRGS